jgi:hypothetical protein
MRKTFLALVACLAATFAFALPFAPVSQGTKTLSCTNASAATALAVTLTSNQTQLEIQNRGTVDVYVEAGVSTVTAAVATGYPVPPGQSKLITVSSSVTHVACIAGSATNTVYVTVGFGDS